MADRELPELKTRLRLDASDLDRAENRLRRFVDSVQSGEGLGRYESQLKSFADRTDQFADKANRNVTLPIVAAGAAATVLSTRFNESFTQMQSLAGVASGEVAALKGEVMDLAGDTARAPQELAEALYFIRSAGLEGSVALDALEASAKGSAIGLGSTTQVADAATSAVNAYGAENLSAAQAVDILAAAVEQGKGEAADFAPQLGQLLPLATNLGVGFEEVAGALAFLTQTGAPASQAATQIAGVFQKLIRPTQQGREELERVGLTVDDLREVVANQGLLPALQLLSDRLGGNQEAFGRIFEDSEGLIGVLALLRENGAPAADVLANVAASSGKVADKFAQLSETEEFQWQQALVDLQRVGIEVGRELIPILADLGGVVTDLTGFFTSLPEPVRTGLIGMLALAAAIGPVAKAASLSASGLSAMFRAIQVEQLSRLSDASTGAATGLSGLSKAGFAASAGLAAFGVTLTILNQLSEVGVDTRGLTTDLQDLAGGTADLSDVAATLGTDVDGLARAFGLASDAPESFGEALGYLGTRIGSDLGGTKMREAQNRVKALDQTLADLAASGNAEAAADAFDLVVQGLRDQGLAYDEIIPLLPLYAAEVDRQERSGGAAADTTDDLTQAQQDLYRQLGITTDGVSEQSDEFAKGAQSARELFDAYRASDDATQAVVDAERELAAAQRAAAGQSEESVRARERIADAERSLADAQRESQAAQEDLSRAREDAAERLEDLQFAAESAALAEVGAGQALERARQDLLKAKTPLDRAEAELRIRQAELALRQAEDATGDTAAELAEAQAKGVEGSDEVVAAQERITQAREREQQAQKQLSDATDAAAKVISDAQAKVETATDKLTDAQLNQADAAADLAGKTDGAKAANDTLIGSLFVLTGQLDPNSPLRKRLLDYIADLQELQGLYGDPPDGQPAPYGPPRPDGTTPTITAPTPGLFGTVADAFRGLTPPTLTSPSSVPTPTPGGKSLVPATTTNAMPNVEVTVQVTGQPDAAMLVELERVAASAVERGLRQAVVG